MEHNRSRQILDDPEILRALALMIGGVDSQPTKQAESSDAELESEPPSDAEPLGDEAQLGTEWDFLVRSRPPRA
ncbi:MAG TPA: hypothetical protein VNW92_13255 [Polyangiaceae bacterium]|jgi:hypothetical protein|nr:hypothetical protein [Polyangiaceae bacterium]